MGQRVLHFFGCLAVKSLERYPHFMGEMLANDRHHRPPHVNVHIQPRPLELMPAGLVAIC